MIARSRVLSLLALAFFLVPGCSNQQEPAPLTGIMKQVLASIQGAGETTPPIIPRDGFLAVSSEFVAAESDPVVGVVLEARNSQALLTPSGQNGNLMTWLSADRTSFTFIGGTMLVRTVGLGNDLQNAEFTQLFTVMASGLRGSTQRVHVHLTRDFQQQRKVFACDVTPMERAEIRISDQSFSTVRFEEACKNEADQFTNVYWLDAKTGLVVQSIQWIHENTGYAYFQIINS
ncbi:MAG: YjbF family lipoprotein [Pseudomonas sp.]